MKSDILYIHGMGGGADSRIPGILKDYYRCTECDEKRDITLTCRTYSFNPGTAQKQISEWIEDMQPSLVIGESLGACHAILAAQKAGVPVLFVSPSLNAPIYLGWFAWVALIPGMRQLFNKIFKPKEGDRQKLDFRFSDLRLYRQLRSDAMKAASEVNAYAFFGTRDHYRKSGIVSIRTWKRHFGEGTWTVYEGTHFMEEEHIHNLLIPKISSLL